jgi:hypothetical protein
MVGRVSWLQCLQCFTITSEDEIDSEALVTEHDPIMVSDCREDMMTDQETLLQLGMYMTTQPNNSSRHAQWMSNMPEGVRLYLCCRWVDSHQCYVICRRPSVPV